jgi:hypothetical protein
VTARAPPLALRAAFAFAGRSGCGCSGAPRLWMRFQIRPAAAWELLKLFTGATPGRLLKVATKRSAGQASASSASSFSLANESKGVVVAPAASSAVANTLMLLSLSIVKVFIIVSPLATLCAVITWITRKCLKGKGNLNRIFVGEREAMMGTTKPAERYGSVGPHAKP